MKRFGFKVHVRKDWRWYLRLVHIPFFILAFVALALFGLYVNVTRIIFSDTIDIFVHDLRDLSLYFRRYDRQISDFLLLLDRVVRAYQRGENIFVTQYQTIDDIVSYVKNNKNRLVRMGFRGYEHLLDFLIECFAYKHHIYDLLGANGERNYIILLQNTAEKRPNGGFFGSFAFVTLQSGFLKNIEVIDSYYPNWIAPDIKLQAPERSRGFIPDGTIGFIAANKFGFTNIDGRNIKNLYNHIFNNPKVYGKKQKVIQPGLFERTFNKKVYGVVFLRSDMLTELFPPLQQKLWEWQFLNANSDLLKQAYLKTGFLTGDFSHKKALYIQEVNRYLKQHMLSFVKAFVMHFPHILQQKKLAIYLVEEGDSAQKNYAHSGGHTPGSLSAFLEQKGLANNFRQDTLYFWDSNDANNKADTFIKKTISLYDANDRLLLTGRNDMLSIAGLDPGIYVVRIKYYFFVPPWYVEFMRGLERKYGITMTERELGILALQPAKNFITGEPKWRGTRATVYAPLHVKFGPVIGDVDQSFLFYPTFANGLFYSMHINTNDTEKGVKIYIEIRK